jgi:hypothetical protein
MTEKMKSFVKGILLGLCGHPLPQGEPVDYYWETVFNEEVTDTDTTYSLTIPAEYGIPCWILRVTVDGDTLEGVLPLGNDSLRNSSGEDTGENFCIRNGIANNWVYVYTRTTGTHSVKIERRIPKGCCSYNGVILAPLPNAAYPYMYISKTLSNLYRLYCSPVKLGMRSTDQFTTADESTATVLAFDMEGGAWSDATAVVVNGAATSLHDPIWCNTPVYHKDGRLILKDTVPVCE